MESPHTTDQESAHPPKQDSLDSESVLSSKPSQSLEDANAKQPDSTEKSQPPAAADDKQSLLPQQQARDVKGEDNQVSPEGSSHPTSDVRYVLSGQPTGWAAMAETVRAYDEEKVKDTKEDIDTLLVFAGLFSAVLTAFLVESYQKLSPDTSSQMLAVMQQIALQTSSYNTVNGMINSTSQPPASIIDAASQPFQPSASDISVNVLWFASLIFSLITASFGMLVKQWLREYLAVENPSPQARLRIRHFRYPELIRWNVFEIAAVLPILQQIALALFFIGLCYFTQSVHESVGHTSLPLVAGWAFCFSTVTILPVFFPRCPFKTTLLKHVLQSIHMISIKVVQKLALRLRNFHLMAQAHTLRDYALTWTVMFVIMLDEHAARSDEEKVITAEQADLNILVDVDALQSNDELLGSTILESLHQIQPEWDNVVDFVLHVLEHRLQRNDLVTGISTPLNLRTLSRAGCTATIDILSHYSSSAISQHVQSDQAITRWSRSKRTMSAFYIFFSPTRYTLPKTGVAVLSQALQHKGTALIELLAHECTRPVVLSDDKFYLLISGLSKVLEDLDINLTLSLQYFETLMNTRFKDAKAAIVDARFPDGNFSVHEDLEAWPWPYVMLADARTEAATLMISTIHRALAQLKKSALTDPLQVLARPKAAVTTVALRPPPSRLVDGVVGMWNMSFVGKIDAYSHTQELRFRAAVEECLTMKESTLALLRALGQIKSKIIVYSHTKWVAFPCGPWLLFEDAQHKLDNLIDAVTDISDAHTLAILRNDPQDKALLAPISTAHLLLICYVVLHMIELPDATNFADQWKSLFTTLTRLGYQTLPSPPLQAVESPPNDVDATPTARQFSRPSYDTQYQLDQPFDTASEKNEDENENEKTEEFEVRERLEQEHVEREQQDYQNEEWQTLVDQCLKLVQKHDIQVLERVQNDDLTENASVTMDNGVYEDWLSRFTDADSVIDSGFVEMLGRIYHLAFGTPRDGDDLQFFRLKKLGILGNPASAWSGMSNVLDPGRLFSGSPDELDKVSEPMTDDVADPDDGDDEVCALPNVDDLKFEDEGPGDAPSRR